MHPLTRLDCAAHQACLRDFLLRPPEPYPARILLLTASLFIAYCTDRQPGFASLERNINDNDFHAVCQDTPCVSTLPELSREPIEEIFVKY